MQYMVRAQQVLPGTVLDPEEPMTIFLAEGIDWNEAWAKFDVDHPGWVIYGVRGARCFKDTGFQCDGPLSLWIGQEDKRAILCEYHGQNP